MALQYLQPTSTLFLNTALKLFSARTAIRAVQTSSFLSPSSIAVAKTACVGHNCKLYAFIWRETGQPTHQIFLVRTSGEKREPVLNDTFGRVPLEGTAP